MRNTFAPTVLLLDETAKNKTTNTSDGLKNLGYNVKHVHSLSDAIESATDFTGDTRPSLILLDFGQISDIGEEKLKVFQDITDSEDMPLVALSESGDQFVGENILTIENLESLPPLMKNLRANA
jgi:DNA-binding response OmpR family regulator